MHLKQIYALLLCVAALGSSTAWASDLQCATTRQPAERVICDHAILNNEYDDIFAEQQNLQSQGKILPEQLARWRQSRNACSDVHCIDTVFGQWKALAKSAQANAAALAVPAEASMTALDAVGPASGSVPSGAAQASPTSEASLVRQGSAAGVALPTPVATQASSAVTASAASAPDDSRGRAGMGAGLVVALLVAIGFGVLFRRRSDGAADRTNARKR